MRLEQENIIYQDIKTLLLPQTLLCMCGCGCSLESQYDSHGRVRSYILGHNRRKNNKKDTIRLEIDKIQTLEQAKAIIYTQAHIIHELQSDR